MVLGVKFIRHSKEKYVCAARNLGRGKMFLEICKKKEFLKRERLSPEAITWMGNSGNGGGLNPLISNLT